MFVTRAGLSAVLSPQDALHPAGVQAAHILQLWNLTLIVCGVVFAAVLVAVLIALMRRPDRPARSTERELASQESRAQKAIVSAGIVSVVLLLGLVVADVLTDRSLSRLPVSDAVHIQVTGEQWWWRANYADDHGQPAFTTANELHVPVGRPIIVSLEAADVIHSFWVPNLHGKKDMLPGLDSTIEFRADKPGTYRGQCAQFCGAEHALMAMLVFAQTPADYEAWASGQAAPAAAEADGTAVTHGLRVFEQSSCANCHSVRGTSARGTLGPDLTHLMSRRTLAAGALSNTPQNLADWIRDPEAVKPGTTMPAVTLTAPDRAALLAWLATLR
ncbi:cytochrome c oxidase subunit II [Paraburkholderia tropica]|uniref:cytochrome c oxidase subunit II n=1 Tax=Paraburkholderia tropica TaxID=92647 RepID=UPI002AB3217F|nr:cytochrome c oxidase subunit II [Paraburkholderia tropica]